LNERDAVLLAQSIDRHADVLARCALGKLGLKDVISARNQRRGDVAVTRQLDRR
jgi:hypothetical protein